MLTYFLEQRDTSWFDSGWEDVEWQRFDWRLHGRSANNQNPLWTLDPSSLVVIESQNSSLYFVRHCSVLLVEKIS